MKKLLILPALLLMLPLSAAAPGGDLSTADLLKSADSVIARPMHRKADFDVIVFFDVLAPDAVACLRMLDTLPDVFPVKTLNVSAVARNDRKTVSEVLSRFKPEYLSVHSENADRTVFRTYAKNEVLIPLAVVVQDGKVAWKGAPAELESVLERMVSGKYSFAGQVRIDILRRDLQSAIQAGLPEVILQSADKILAIAPADTIAIQAKLYVFEGRQRPDLAKAFLLERVGKTPGDVRLRVLLLNTLISMNDAGGFRKALLDAMKTPNIRILAFALDNAPFGWLPLAEMNEAAKLACAPAQMSTNRLEVLRLEVLARLAYLSMNIDEAIRFQTQAAERPGGANARFMLDYYKSVRDLRTRTAK